MKSKTKRSHKKPLHAKKGLPVSVIGLGILLLSFFIGYVGMQRGQNLKIASSVDSRDNLQLETFYPSSTLTPTVIPPTATKTPAPTSGAGGVCPHDMGKKLSDPNVCSCNGYKVECVNDKCAHIISEVPLFGVLTCADWDRYGWCNPAIQAREGNGWYCLGKPVIYLYPEKQTIVNVRIQTEGKVVVSDPLYPEGGWQGVLAHPDGILNYQGNTYRELFYETESATLSSPKKGIIIKRNELEARLRNYINLLGLTNKSEQDEFLDWWLPKLNALNSPYILFSILEREEKARLDVIEINPKPDTFIDFIAYFKPLNKIEQIEPLEIAPAPERSGFTAVEWGGVLDR